MSSGFNVQDVKRIKKQINANLEKVDNHRSTIV